MVRLTHRHRWQRYMYMLPINHRYDKYMITIWYVLFCLSFIISRLCDLFPHNRWGCFIGTVIITGLMSNTDWKIWLNRPLSSNKKTQQSSKHKDNSWDVGVFSFLFWWWLMGNYLYNVPLWDRSFLTSFQRQLPNGRFDMCEMRLWFLHRYHIRE